MKMLIRQISISQTSRLLTSVFFVNDDENDDENDENILNYRRWDKNQNENEDKRRQQYKNQQHFSLDDID